MIPLTKPRAAPTVSLPVASPTAVTKRHEAGRPEHADQICQTFMKDKSVRKSKDHMSMWP